MIVDKPYSKGMTGLSPYLRSVMRLSASKIKSNNDDCIILIAGKAGTGKSLLGLTIYEDLDPEGCSIDYVGSNLETFAIAQYLAKDKEGFRYCQYDEGKLNRQRWQAEHNQDLLELYHDNRAFNIFHVWCSAMPALINKMFIEERVKGCFFLNSKSKGVRPVWFFTKKKLLSILEKEGSIDNKYLNKYKSQATIKGWVTEYNGKLRKEYEARSIKAKSDTSQKFYQKYSKGQLFSVSDVARRFAMARTTVKRYLDKAISCKLLDVEINPNGKILLNLDQVSNLESFIQENSHSVVKNDT